MKFLGILMIALSFVTIQGCSTVGQVWESGKDFVTGTVDAAVTGTSKVVSAVAEDVVDTAAFVADTGAGIVEDVNQFRIDRCNLPRVVITQHLLLALLDDC